MPVLLLSSDYRTEYFPTCSLLTPIFVPVGPLHGPSSEHTESATQMAIKDTHDFTVAPPIINPELYYS